MNYLEPEAWYEYSTTSIPPPDLLTGKKKRFTCKWQQGKLCCCCSASNLEDGLIWLLLLRHVEITVSLGGEANILFPKAAICMGFCI